MVKDDSLENNNLRMRSGSVDSTNRLVSFLYELMRDHVPMGIVEELVRSSSTEKCCYTNGWLARYAEDVAARLEGSGTVTSVPVVPKVSDEDNEIKYMTLQPFQLTEVSVPIEYADEYFRTSQIAGLNQDNSEDCDANIDDGVMEGMYAALEEARIKRLNGTL